MTHDTQLIAANDDVPSNAVKQHVMRWMATSTDEWQLIRVTSR